MTREQFMKEITELVRKVVGVIKTGEIPDVVYATVPAPCQKCDFSIWKVTSGREWSTEEAAELISKRKVGPLTGFRSRMGKPFAAVVRLTDELRPEFDFGQAGGEGEEGPDFSA